MKTNWEFIALIKIVDSKEEMGNLIETVNLVSEKVANPEPEITLSVLNGPDKSTLNLTIVSRDYETMVLIKNLMIKRFTILNPDIDMMVQVSSCMISNNKRKCNVTTALKSYKSDKTYIDELVVDVLDQKEPSFTTLLFFSINTPDPGKPSINTIPVLVKEYLTSEDVDVIIDSFSSYIEDIDVDEIDKHGMIAAVLDAIPCDWEFVETRSVEYSAIYKIDI
ncbi:MAG: hypothetical protein PHF63_00180 [Herbinix sp.]|nr:hypothetical protein [Herbinix sp.]